MSTAYAFTTAPSQETLSNEAIAGLILVCIAINACTRSSSAKTWVSTEEEEKELSHPVPPAPAPPAPAPAPPAPAPAAPAPAPPAPAPAAPAPAPAPAAPAPAPAPAPKQRIIHEGLAESVQAVLSKTPQTAREICSKLSEAYPILTKSEVNSCLYTLSSKKQAKQVYSPKGSPRWTTL